VRAEAARALLARGAVGVVVKGGHGREDPVRDLVLEAGRPPRWHAHARVPGVDLHGSGCRYATALAARLAAGDELPAAADAAGRFLAGRLAAHAAARARRPGPA
jgi:hydroxymethylpyrimidine/phosphomethylpyrimidine kinase